MRGFHSQLGVSRDVYPRLLSNLRFLTVLTSSCTIMHKLPSAQNFSDVQGKSICHLKKTLSPITFHAPLFFTSSGETLYA